jgi:hypothetical protein
MLQREADSKRENNEGEELSSGLNLVYLPALLGAFISFLKGTKNAASL